MPGLPKRSKACVALVVASGGLPADREGTPSPLSLKRRSREAEGRTAPS